LQRDAVGRAISRAETRLSGSSRSSFARLLVHAASRYLERPRVCAPRACPYPVCRRRRIVAANAKATWVAPDPGVAALPQKGKCLVVRRAGAAARSALRVPPPAEGGARGRSRRLGEHDAAR